MKTTGVLPTNIDLETPRLLLYNNKPFIGYFFTGIGTCLVISELIYFYVVYKILMILHQNSSSFSRRSIKLHRQLTLLLAAQVSWPLKEERNLISFIQQNRGGTFVQMSFLTFLLNKTNKLFFSSIV
jgi:hypothetical protein